MIKVWWIIVFFFFSVSCEEAETPTRPASQGAEKSSVKDSNGASTANEDFKVYPSFEWLEPRGGNDVAGKNGSFVIKWRSADYEPSATIELFYAKHRGTLCQSGTKIGKFDVASQKAQWSIGDLIDGLYYICARVKNSEDEIEESWSPSFIAVASGSPIELVPPTLSFVSPSNNDDFIEKGAVLNIHWNDDEKEQTAVLIDLYYKTSNLGLCTEGGVQIANDIGMEIDSLFDVAEWDTGSLVNPGRHFYVCAQIRSQDFNFSVYSDPVQVYDAAGPCFWTGNEDHSWEKSTNWEACSGGTPGSTDFVIVDELVQVSPLISSNIEIKGFAPNLGGGVVTVAAGVTMALSDQAGTVQSSVTLKGDSATCEDCLVSLPNGMTVNNDATLSLRDGIRLVPSSTVSFGDGASPGHLDVLSENADMSQWPRFQAPSGSLPMIRFLGAPDQRSQAKINGLYFSRFTGFNYLQFKDDYDLVQLDRVFLYTTSHYRSQISFSNCEKASSFDNSWQELFMDHAGGHMASDTIGLSESCRNHVSTANVSVSGDGRRYGVGGRTFLNWGPDGSQSVCEWNGSASGDIGNPANWSNCNNAEGYPLARDWVVIPDSLTNYPLLETRWYIMGFAESSNGGGQIQLSNTGRIFLNARDAFKSDIRISGSNAFDDSCGNSCGVFANYWNGFTVEKGATLTIGPGVRFDPGYGDPAGIGANGTAGHLVVEGGADSNLWPSFTTFNAPNTSFSGLRVEGSDGLNRSTVSIDGLRINDIRKSAIGLEFASNFSLVKFDNVFMDTERADPQTRSADLISFGDCSNGSIIKDWNVTFVGDDTQASDTFAVRLSSNCSAGNVNGGSPIEVTSPSSNLFGSEFDQNSILEWITPI